MDVWEKVKIHMEMDVFESMVLFKGNLLGFLRSSTRLATLSKNAQLTLRFKVRRGHLGSRFVVSWECKGPNPLQNATP